MKYNFNHFCGFISIGASIAHVERFSVIYLDANCVPTLFSPEEGNMDFKKNFILQPNAGVFSKTKVGSLLKTGPSLAKSIPLKRFYFLCQII